MQRGFRNLVMALIGLVFLIPVSGFALNLVQGTDGVSEGERRALAALPTFDGHIRDYTASFDDYLEDNFGFRMEFIRLARKVRDNLGENPPDVIVGKDGWLFIGNSAYRDEFEGNGDWDAAQVDDWVETLKALQDELVSRGVPFVGFIGIDKARAFPDKLPDDWTWGTRRFRTAIHRHLETDQTGLIDAEPFVLAAKDRGEKVFWVRDTHWTPDGTYDLAMALLDRFDPKGLRPRFQPAPPRMKSARRLLDLEGMAGYADSQEPEHLMIDIPSTHDGFLVVRPPKDKTAPQRDQFSTWEIAGTNDAPEGRLVIVGDSFGDAILEHLRVSYAEIIRLHHGAHYFDVTLDEILAENPDAVLFAIAERQAWQKAQPVQLFTP